MHISDIIKDAEQYKYSHTTWYNCPFGSVLVFTHQFKKEAHCKVYMIKGYAIDPKKDSIKEDSLRGILHIDTSIGKPSDFITRTGLKVKIPYGRLRNAKYRESKSKAICPGLDLRPLQQRLRTELGDLARFRHLYYSLCGKGFITTRIYEDWEECRKAIYARYEADKARLIANHKEREKINARIISHNLPF